ncbi:MAG TPA: rod shape-determining protein MreD [Candidatus Sulfotelmatobacter sp.]|nr:rod shape-determining protein MreD [Candidatus Sulfotelmatobacter sp.]
MSSFSRTTYRSVEIAVGPAYWPALGWTSLLALLQTTLIPLLAFRQAVPSLVTIAVVLFAVRAGARRGAALAIPAGVLEDVFTGGAGGWTLSTTLVALLVGGFSRRMFADGVVAPAVLCGGASFVRDVMYWIFQRAVGYPAGYAVQHVHTALWRALLTALVAFVWLTLRGRFVHDKTTVERYP